MGSPGYENVAILVKQRLGEQARGHFTAHHRNQLKWVKYGPSQTISLEVQGYQAISKVAPTSKLESIIDLKNGTSFLVYRLLDELKDDTGLFAHAIHNQGWKDSWPHVKANIMSMYGSASSVSTQGHWIDYFTLDRLEGRLKAYPENFIKLWTKEYKVCGRGIGLDLRNVIDKTTQFFNNPIEQLCVLGQSDLNDRNITRNGIILDYEGGGLNPIAAEAATFWVYYWLFTGFIAPKYQADECPQYMKAFNILSGDFEPSLSQQVICTEYFNDIIEGKHPNELDDSWYAAFRAYATMRIMCVIDLRKLSVKDAEIVFSHLALLHSAKSWKELIW